MTFILILIAIGKTLSTIDDYTIFDNYNINQIEKNENKDSLTKISRNFTMFSINFENKDL